MRLLNKESDWDLDAGLLPLDFANTADWHASSKPTERLNSYSDLVEWSWKAGLLTETEAQLLLEKAEERPKEASEALTQAIRLREAVYRIISTVAAGEEVPTDSLETLNTYLAEALSHAKILPSDGGFLWGWSGEERSLGRMLWPILRATANLLASDDLTLVGECADDRGCGYLFFDTSRNHSRRWCSMESCGNRAKVLRHYSRKKARK
jgi:predicted RNA-binding Zn ribbon-like protein